MRVAAAIGLGLFLVGAALTWVGDRVLAGAIVMVVANSGLLVLVVLSASRNASAGDGDVKGSEPAEEQNEHVQSGWLRL